jgi:nucleotide-binding universal stress UspA family protein
MKKIFNRILVPVNFNRNTALVIDKALQLANHFSCDIHILHVQSPTTIPFLYNGFFPESFVKSSNTELVKKMKLLEEHCKPKLDDGLLVTTAVVLGNWQAIMKETVIREHIDLVIIPKNKYRFGTALIQQINLNRLSQQTQCPVLTVTAQFNINELQNIVVPINDCLPVKKLTLATYLSRQANGRIHLMGGGGNSPGGRNKRRYLIKAYQLLTDYGNVKIHCALPENYDNPASTLSYAKHVNADLIVINTGKESLHKGWWNKLVGKYLYKESDIPVLTISPQ